ncbi:MAG: hypothetical protein ACTJFN_05275, partial [Sphingobacterium sp.]
LIMLKRLHNFVQLFGVSPDLSLTCIDFSIPEYGEFTRFEWIWFNIYHTQRHMLQLESMILANNIKEP